MTSEGYTPEIVFGYLLARGFASSGEAENTIKEFAATEEFDWARQMLLGFREE